MPLNGVGQPSLDFGVHCSQITPETVDIGIAAAHGTTNWLSRADQRRRNVRI
jgi:hypothetical protein